MKNKFEILVDMLFCWVREENQTWFGTWRTNRDPIAATLIGYFNHIDVKTVTIIKSFTQRCHQHDSGHYFFLPSSQLSFKIVD